MTAIAGDHAAIKQELLRALNEIAALADEVGMSSLANDLKKTRIPKLDEERFAFAAGPAANDDTRRRLAFAKAARRR